MKSCIAAIFLLLSPVITFAQVVPGELKCAEAGNDGTHFDVHLQPDSHGNFHFKRCYPGYDSGLNCIALESSQPDENGFFGVNYYCKRL